MTSAQWVVKDCLRAVLVGENRADADAEMETGRLNVDPANE